MVTVATSTSQNSPPANMDFAAVKSRQHGAWSSGDYAIVGTTLQIVGEELCEALDIRAHDYVLDVAAGNGNASLAAARRWCDVVATDYVPALLDRARERAEADRLNIGFMEADAEALPFPCDSFDIVVSTFGVMFTPDQERAAAEMARVCKHDGKIGLANWTPEGFIGQVFKTIGKHAPPPPGVRSPAQWGTRARLGELFEPHASSIRATPRNISCFAIARRRIGSTCSGPTTVRCSRRSVRLRRLHSWNSSRTFWPWSRNSTARTMAPWWCPANTLRSSFAEPDRNCRR